jgi:formylglycine-generating enzyme
LKSVLWLSLAAVVFLASCTKGPESGEVRINTKDGAEMVWVPAGEFLMGTTENYPDQMPQRRVYLDGYWMYKYPVTAGQYRKFCNETGHPMPNVTGVEWKDDYPITWVTWDDAAEYAEWAGVRLPTEAQWEKAARGTDGRLYPWGNEWDSSRCAPSISADCEIPPLGSHPEGASPYGCLDMAGYVLEWCSDWYDPDYYAHALARNPTGPSEMVEFSDGTFSFTGGAHVLRGAEVLDEHFSCAGRYYHGTDMNCNLFGFRCAMSDDR